MQAPGHPSHGAQMGASALSSVGHQRHVYVLQSSCRLLSRLWRGVRSDGCLCQVVIIQGLTSVLKGSGPPSMLESNANEGVGAVSGALGQAVPPSACPLIRVEPEVCKPSDLTYMLLQQRSAELCSPPQTIAKSSRLARVMMCLPSM